MSNIIRFGGGGGSGLKVISRFETTFTRAYNKATWPNDGPYTNKITLPAGMDFNKCIIIANASGGGTNPYLISFTYSSVDNSISFVTQYGHGYDSTFTWYITVLELDGVKSVQKGYLMSSGTSGQFLTVPIANVDINKCIYAVLSSGSYSQAHYYLSNNTSLNILSRGASNVAYLWYVVELS